MTRIKNNQMKNLMKGKLPVSLLVAAIIMVLHSCSHDKKDPGYEFMPDMYRSPSYETYSANPNFEDGMTARQPVKGTIPRGFMPFGYPNTNEGYEAAGTELKSPLARTEENLIEGERLYGVFCMQCHGKEGKGDGTIIKNEKFPPPPSYSGQLKDLVEGKMYWTITYGKNLMGSHASQLNSAERWKVILYVQKLQLIDQLNNQAAPTAAAE